MGHKNQLLIRRYHLGVARFRVGPVRVGGGRRASFTANAGPFGVTVGGRRKRRSGSTSAAERSNGQSTGPSAAEERQYRRDWEREQRRYSEWYATLTPAEQLFEERRKWEDQECMFVGQNDGPLNLRWGFLVFSLVEFILVLWLLNGSWLQSPIAILGACGLNHWSVKNFPVYRSLRSVVLGLSHRDYWWRWSVIFLISALSIFIGPFKGVVALIGFGLVVWSAWRFVNLRVISNEIASYRNLFEELSKNGVINEDHLNVVWHNLNELIIVSACFEESNYFRIDRFFADRRSRINAANVKVDYPRPVIKFDSANPRRRRRKPSAGDSD